MSVTSVTDYAGPFAPDGVTTVFPFPFAALSADEVAVIRIAADWTETILSGYTVQLNDSGGSVTFSTPPLAGDPLYLVSNPSFEQQTRFATQGRFSAAAIEKALDRAAIRDIVLAGAISRAALAPPADTLGILPPADQRAGKFFAFDAEGQAVAASGTGADIGLRTDLAGVSGGDLIGFLPTVAGAVMRSLSAWFGDFAWPAGMFGARGDGTTDDTAALQRPLTLGVRCRLKNATYLITQGLNHSTGGGFVCPDGTATIKAKTGAGGFNIKNVIGGSPRLGLDRNILLCNLTDDLVLRNVHFTTDGAAEAVLHGVRMYGGMAGAGYDIDVSFSGFAVGSMVVLSSTGDGTRKNIRIRSARNSGATLGNSYWTGVPQTTVLEIDNDTIAGAGSVGGSVVIDEIKNWLFSGQALTDFGNQTDGANLLGTASGWQVKISLVDGCAEPVDCFGTRNRFDIGVIRNAYNFAIKLIHGAQFNDVYAGTIEACGQAAVSIWGSDEATRDTTGNNVRVGTVKNPGSYGYGLVLPVGESAAAVLFGNSNLVQKPTNNTVRIENIIGDGVNLDIVVLDGGSTAGNNNRVTIGKASGWLVQTVSAPPSNVRVRYLGRNATEMTMTAAQSIANATATQLAFDTVGLDLEGVANTTAHKVTVLWPGLYRVQVAALLPSWRVGTDDQWTMEIRQNTTVKMRTRGRINFTAKEDTAIAFKEFYIDESQVGTANADITAWLTQDTGASKTLGTTVYQTLFNVTRVS